MLMVVDKIENSEIEKYILENRSHSIQFDEIEKREGIIKSLVTDEDIDDVIELFGKIISEMRANAT